MSTMPDDRPSRHADRSGPRAGARARGAAPADASRWHPLLPLFEQQQRQVGLEVTRPDPARIQRLLAPHLARLTIDARSFAQRCAVDPLERLALLDLAPRAEPRWLPVRAHLADLERRVVPEAVARQRSTSRPELRIWCTSASGELAYSIALVLARSLPNRERWDASVLATDVSLGALARAQVGLYTTPRGLEPAERKALFVPTRGSPRLWSVRPELRRLVHSAWLDPRAEWPFAGPFDAVFCSEFLGRLDVPTRARAVERLARATRPGGSIYLGVGEEVAGVAERFARVRGPGIRLR